MRQHIAGTVVAASLLLGTASAAFAVPSVHLSDPAATSGTALVQQVSYYWNHHRWQHRRWDRRHRRWDYYGRVR